MAWVTKLVVGGEIRSVSEARTGDLGYNWSFGANGGSLGVHTGSYAAYSIGRDSGIGLSMEGVTWTSLRSGYWFKSEGWWTPSSMAFFKAYDYEEDVTKWSYMVRMNWTDYQIELVNYDWVTDTIYTLDTTNDIDALLGAPADWKHVSLFHNKTTNWVKFWVNGEQLLSAQLSYYPDERWLYACEHGALSDIGGEVYIDDYYIDLSTSSEAADTPPARKYYPALPDGAGTYTNWTPVSGSNYENVDDPSTPDDDTTYVSTGANATVDSYSFAALSGVDPEASPDSAVVQAYVRTVPVGDGVANLKLMTCLGGSEDTTSAQRIRRQVDGISPRLYLDWIVISGFFDTKPTGGEWSETDFNNAEFGIESDGIL